MAEPISLDPVTTTPQVSLDTSIADNTFPLPPKVATPRALQAEVGIGRYVNKDYQEIYQRLSGGDEKTLRAEAATSIDLAKMNHRNQTLVNIARQAGRGLAPEEVAHIDATLKSLYDPTASNSVFEEYFSKEYLDLVNKTGSINPDTSMYKAIKAIPQQIEVVKQGTSKLLSKRLQALTLAEDLETQSSEQSYLGQAIDVAKELIPFYSQYKTSGQVPGVSSLMGKGSNWEAQARAAWLLPDDQYTATLQNIANTLGKDNPSLAAQFLRAIAGQSSSEIALGNLFTAIDVASIPGAGKLGSKVLEGIGMFNSSQRSYKAMLDAATAKGTLESKPAMIEASGDLRGAGITEFSVRTAKELSGQADPMVDGISGLAPALRAELAGREINPGSHSREIVNRLNETTSKNSFILTNVIENIMKVERTPVLVAIEKMARAALDKFKEDYSGHFLTNEKVVAGPAGTNTKFFQADLLRPDGTLFGDEASAKMYAAKNGIAIKGEDPVLAMEIERQLKLAKGELEYFQMAAAKAQQGLPIRLGQPQPFPPVPVLLTEANKSPKFAANMKALEDRVTTLQDDLLNIKTKPGAVVIAPEGKANGYAIRFTNPLNETDPLIRQGLMEAPGAPAPKGWINSVIGRFRTPEDTLSVNQRENRKVATYSTSTLREAAEELGRDIDKLSRWTLPFTKRRERWKDFERVLAATKDLRDPIDGEPGYLFKSPGELDVFYQQVLGNGRRPDEQELRAFFGYKDLVEMHDALHRNTVYNKMTRVGTQEHTFTYIDDAGRAVKGPAFNGTIQDTMPGGDTAVLVVGHKPADTYVYYGGNLSPKGAKSLKEGIEGKVVEATEPSEEFRAFVSSGEREMFTEKEVYKELEARFEKGELKVVKLYNDSDRPFQSMKVAADKRIGYVITDRLETRPLSWDTIPRRRGGFFDTDYEHYLAQAIVKKEQIGKEMRHWYEGDRMIMPIGIRAMGKDIEKHLNAIRELIRDNKLGEANQYVTKNLGDMKFDEINSWFNPSVNKFGVEVGPMLDVNEAIRMVPKNKLIGHIDDSLEKKYEAIQKGSYKDGTRYGYLDKEIEETLFQSTLKDEGTIGNPLYKVAPVRYLDPIPNMNRALSRIINSSVMEDYKAFSVEHWLQEAAQWLKNPDDIARSPYWNFFKPEFRDAAPKEIVSRLQTQNFQIQQLLGVPSESDALLHRAAQAMHDSIYLKAGQRTAEMITPVWLMPKLKDPFAFVRSIAFHAKLGLFNIPQLMVQAQTFVNIMGVAGIKYAAPGVRATLLHEWSRVNASPEVLGHLDKLASTSGLIGTASFRPGEWLEAYNLLKSSGFANVAGEYAMRDQLYSSKIVTSGAQKMLDWGTAPFREGEKAVRLGAWYTAFKEFRDLHPTGRITEQDARTILNRADLLTVNMSRASNSTLHTGVWSLPTQFLTYQIRTFEQFLGKRLTPIEKARLFGTYAAVYGVPTALGVTGLPLGDLLRKDALEKGYVVGDRWIESAVNEGIPSMLLALTTGNFYNISERYGIQGFSTIREAMRGDQPWWKVFGGAAFSTLAGTVESLDGFTHAVMSGIRADGKFPFRIEDVIDPFKEIASVNSVWKVGMAIHTGKWMSKKESFVDSDITPSNAVFMGLTGLQSQKATDVNLITWSQRNQKELETEGLNRFVKEFRRAQETLRDGNKEQHLEYMKRAFTYLRITGYPIDKYDKAISIAADGYQSMIDRLDYSFYFENAPDALRKIRSQAYQKILQQRRILREQK